jgi:hypothetical protein
MDAAAASCVSCDLLLMARADHFCAMTLSAPFVPDQWVSAVAGVVAASGCRTIDGWILSTNSCDAVARPASGPSEWRE